MPVKLAALLIVWLLIVLLVDMVVIPLKAPELMIKPLMVLVAVGPLKAPALVMVPLPVVEMFDDVLMVFAVLIVPKPLAIEPTVSAPTFTKFEYVNELSMPAF